MKLGTVVPYLKNINKIFKSRDIPQHFHTRNQQFLLYQEMQIKIAY